MDNDNMGSAVAELPVVARRAFLGRAGRFATVGAIVAIAACSEGDESPLANTPTPTPSGTPTPTPAASPSILPVSDVDLLTLMVQLQYLQAEFYARAVLGAPLASSLVTGAGAAGDVVGPRAVTIADPILADYLREIAVEKIDQLVRLRAVLGSAVPARPALNLSMEAGGSFARYATEATPVTVPATAPVLTDVYAGQDQLLLGAFVLEDAVVSAWRGIATLMTSAANIDVAAGMLATCAFHAGLIRSQLFLRGGATGSVLRTATVRLSDLRDSFTPTVDDDRGVSSGSGSSLAADINPSDGEGEIYGRLPNLTINTFYMTRSVATSGGFFPAGLNGVLRESVFT
ncbi:hypothetical protein ASE75_02815 [Sphingomonas sp. Leaf17]|uniref:ferritin-like domain-containing protein n=1 Tax=Sphingomonas sp. Leaf17 TaxID=1735683 RepID=UPI0006F4FDA7|nr:ferritin-like domain-containing protein [Sphingomonas sp. Leaf17]KQM67835.1 hypothetical protein ASE75_02815 [Sphingomonas sp. Leaf17]